MTRVIGEPWARRFTGLPNMLVTSGQYPVRPTTSRSERLHSQYSISARTGSSRLGRPRSQGLEYLIQTISQRTGADMECGGLLVRDIENTYPQLEASDESSISDLLAHSITYLIAVDPGRLETAGLGR